MSVNIPYMDGLGWILKVNKGHTSTSKTAMMTTFLT